jgi:hypothetical protein
MGGERRRAKCREIVSALEKKGRKVPVVRASTVAPSADLSPSLATAVVRRCRQGPTGSATISWRLATGLRRQWRRCWTCSKKAAGPPRFWPTARRVSSIEWRVGFDHRAGWLRPTPGRGWGAGWWNGRPTFCRISPADGVGGWDCGDPILMADPALSGGRGGRCVEGSAKTVPNFFSGSIFRHRVRPARWCLPGRRSPVGFGQRYLSFGDRAAGSTRRL